MKGLITRKLSNINVIKQTSKQYILSSKFYSSFEKQQNKFVSLRVKDSVIKDTKIYQNDIYSSSLEKGKSFEILCLNELSKYGLDIVHTGNTGDGKYFNSFFAFLSLIWKLKGGIDFKGTWSFPDGDRIEVLGQCKNEEKKTPVKYIREFIGSIESKQSLNKSLGIFISSSDFSIQAKNYFMISKYPMILMVYSGIENKLIKAYINHSGQNILPKLLIIKNNESSDINFLYGL